MTLAVVLMGVSGCGKTTIGRSLAEKLSCQFYDGDDFHPPENIAKMSGGIPLDDNDRAPWLARLHDMIHNHLARRETIILACSALKKRYRDQLRAGNNPVHFIHLYGSFDLIWERMQTRQDHYMKAEMLQSQFDALEFPGLDEATTINITGSVDEIINIVLRNLTTREAAFTKQLTSDFRQDNKEG